MSFDKLAFACLVMLNLIGIILSFVIMSSYQFKKKLLKTRTITKAGSEYVRHLTRNIFRYRCRLILTYETRL